MLGRRRATPRPRSATASTYLPALSHSRRQCARARPPLSSPRSGPDPVGESTRTAARCLPQARGQRASACCAARCRGFPPILMEAKEMHNRDVLVDLEKGNCLLTREDNYGTEVDSNSIDGRTRTKLDVSSWGDLVALKDDRSHHKSCSSSHCRDSVAKNGESTTSEGEMKVGFSDNSSGDKEKKKWPKKPPRPPRPLTTSPLDPADQKLISELSELAVLKRARVERMKALKKMKNTKPASSIGNLVALIITVIFCFFILWQGIPTGNL